MSQQPSPISASTPAAFRDFCSAAATVMAEQVFEKAADDDASLTAKMEAAKWFAKMADYEPKANTLTSAGSGFQLVINFNGANEAIGTTIDVTPSETADTTLLEAPPAHVAIRPTRNFQFLTHDDQELQPA